MKDNLMLILLHESSCKSMVSWGGGLKSHIKMKAKFIGQECGNTFPVCSEKKIIKV